MESTVLDRIPDPQPTDVHIPSTGHSRGIVETMESSLSLQASAALQTLSLISSDSRLTSKQCHVAKEIESSLFEKVKALTDKVFGRLKDRIANRKMYVLFEEQLKCNTNTDHLVPKNVLPIFEEHIDAASDSLYSHIYSIVHTSTQALFDASQKQEPLPTNRVNELESLVYQMRLQIEQLQQDYAVATDRFATEQANALSELTRLREQLWQKHKYAAEYEPDFNPYITPSKWGTIGLLTGGTSGIEDRKAVLTRLLDDERAKCAELRNKITQLEIQVYAKSQQVDLLPMLYEEIDTLKKKLVDYESILHNYEESKNLEISMFQAKEEALKEELSRLQSRLSQSSDQARSSKAAVAELTKRLSQKDLSLPVSSSSQHRGDDCLEAILSGTIPLPKNDDISRPISDSSAPQSMEGSRKTHKRTSSIADIGIDSYSNSDNISISSINMSAKSTRPTKEKKKSKGKSRDGKHTTVIEKHKDTSIAEKHTDTSHHNQRGEQLKEKKSVLNKAMKSDAVDKRPASEPFEALDAASHDPSILLDNPMQSELSSLRLQIEALQKENTKLQTENSKLRDSCLALEATVAEIKDQAEHIASDIHISKKDISRIDTHEDLQTLMDQPDKVQMKQDKKEELRLLKQKLMKKHIKKERARKRITALILTKERFNEFREEVDNDKTLIPRVDYHLISNKTLAPEDVYNIIGSISTHPSILTHGDFLHSMDYRILEHTVSCVEDLVNKRFRDEVSMDGTCSEYIWFSESCSDSRCNDFDDLESDLEGLNSYSKTRGNSSLSQGGRQLKDSLGPASSPLTCSSDTAKQRDNNGYDEIPKSLLSRTEKPQSKGSEHNIEEITSHGHTDANGDELKLRLYHEYVHIDPSELSTEALASLFEMDEQSKQNIRSIINQLLLNNSAIDPAALGSGLHLLVASDQGAPTSVYMTNRSDTLTMDDSINSDQVIQIKDRDAEETPSAQDLEALDLDSERSGIDSRQPDGQSSVNSSRKLYQSGLLRVVANATETVRDIMPNKPLYIASASDKEHTTTRSRGRNTVSSQPSPSAASLESLGLQQQVQAQDQGPQRPHIIHTIQSAILRSGLEALLHGNKFTLSDTGLCNDSGTELETVSGSTKVTIVENGDIFIGTSHIGNAKQLTLDERITDFYTTLVNTNIIRKSTKEETSVMPVDNTENNTDLTASMLADHSSETGVSTFTLKDMYIKSSVRITTNPSNPSVPLQHDVDQTIQRGTFGSLSVKSYLPIHTDYSEIDRIYSNIKHKVRVDIADALRDIKMVLKMLGHDPRLTEIKVINPTHRIEQKTLYTISNPVTHDITNNLKALSKDDKLTLFLEAILAKQITWGDLKTVFEQSSPVMNYLMSLHSQLSNAGDVRDKPLTDDLVKEDRYLDDLSNILLASQIVTRAAEDITGSSSAELPTRSPDLKCLLETLPVDQQQLVYEIAKLLKEREGTTITSVEPSASISSKGQNDNPIVQLLNGLTHINYDAIVQILFNKLQTTSERRDSFDENNEPKDSRYISGKTENISSNLDHDMLGIFTDPEWQELEKTVPVDALRFIRDKLILEQEKLDELSMIKQQLYILRQAEHAAMLSYEAPISEEIQCPEGKGNSDVIICSTCGQEVTHLSRASSAPDTRSLGCLPSQSGTEGESIRLDFLPGSDLCLEHLTTSTSSRIPKASRENGPSYYGSVPNNTLQSHPVLAPDAANSAVTTLVTGNRSRYAEHLPIMGFAGGKINQKYRHLVIRNRERAAEIQERLGLLSVPRQRGSYPINYQYNSMNIPFAFAARTPRVIADDTSKLLSISMEVPMLTRGGKAHIVNLSGEADSFLQKQLHLSQTDYSSKQHMIRAKRASDAVQNVISHYARKFPAYTKLNWVIPNDPRDIFIRLYQNARELRERYEKRFQAKLLLETELFNRYRQTCTYVPGAGMSKHIQSGLPSHHPVKESLSLTNDLSISTHTPQATYVCNDSIAPDNVPIDGDSSQFRDCIGSMDGASVNVVQPVKASTELNIPIPSPRLLLSGIQESQSGKPGPNSNVYVPEYEKYNRQAHISSLATGSAITGKPIISTPSAQGNKPKYTILHSGIRDTHSARDDQLQLQLSGIHMSSRTVHGYDNNTGGKLSIQAKIHSQIDDSRLDELSKSAASFSESAGLTGTNNTTQALGSSSKTYGRLLSKPLKPIQSSTKHVDEPVNVSITSITDIFIGEEPKRSGSKEMSHITEVFTGGHRSRSIRKSAALAFRNNDARTEEKLSVGSRN